MLAFLGGFAYRYRWSVIAGWLIVLVVGVLFGSGVFGRLEVGMSAREDVESAEVERRLAEFGGVGADVVVLTLRGAPRPMVPAGTDADDAYRSSPPGESQGESWRS